MQDNLKQFLTTLRTIGHSRSLYRAFSDWLEIAAITLHQLPYHSRELEKDDSFKALEERYLQSIKPYSKDELDVFAELLGLTLATHNAGYGDFLGEVAGDAELLNKGSGQFFTPYYLCRTIAKMTLGDVKGLVKHKGIITVCEPASGAGALVIASAEEVAAQGIDPRAHLQFDCTDISRDAFNMTYIQLCAQNLQAIVRHGNSLTDEYWESRPTPQLRLFHQWLDHQQRSERLAQAVRSLFAAESIPVPATSATLFDLDKFTVEKPRRKRDRRRPDILLDRQISLFGS